MKTSDIEDWNLILGQMSIDEALHFVLSKVEGRSVFSTSFGIEDQMITHIVSNGDLPVEVFTLDTGRLFSQTYDVFEKTQKTYKNIEINTFFPDETDVCSYILDDGINGFYNSVESRKRCCNIRKVKPLKRALEGVSLWITGLRSEQSPNREKMRFLEVDDHYNLVKYNPLLNYSLDQVEAFVKTNKIPINSLYYKGFLSIGCAPCTRALESGEDFRAGRWWWEQSHKECGLHR